MSGISEDSRYTIYRVGCHLSWWSVFTWAAAITFVNLSHSASEPPTTFERASQLPILLLLGVAVALSLTLARMRLTKTMTTVFEAGMRIAQRGNCDDD
mgnify:CR=1 FL=1